LRSTLRAPIDPEALKSVVRRALPGDGQAAFLSLAFLYFWTATSLLGLPGDGRLSVASVLDVVFYSSLLVLPLFVVAAAVDLAEPGSRVRRIGRGVLWGLLLANAAISGIDFLASLYFSQRITPGVIFVLAETNFSESREFVSMYASFDLLLVTVFVALPFVIRRIAARARSAAMLRRAIVGGVLASSLGGLLQACIPGPEHYNPSMALFSGILEYREELRAYHEIEQAVNIDLPGGAVATSKAERNLHVLVLGESTARAHMGLYGYRRDTTPRFTAMRDELLVFEDVVSPHSHTIAVLKKLLTFANNESPRSWHEYPVLFDVYRAAGFKSYWISNQEAYGIWANTSSVLASRADVRIFNNPESSRRLKSGLDSELLKYLDEVLASDDARDQLIVLQLMGTHGKYGERYPAEFDVFNGANIDAAGRDFLDTRRKKQINRYDNAVRYNDHVVSEIIERVRGVNASSYVLYVSDHGEEVYDERDFVGHTEEIGNRFMIEIPFVLWLSPGYRALHGERVASLESNLESAAMTDDLIHTLLDLSSIETATWEASRSLARREFSQNRKRIYAGFDYDRDLKTDHQRSLVRDPSGKVWAHRVNSIKKLEESGATFSGVELDLVFVEEDGASFFDVNHPPADSIGLSLDDYLASRREPGSLRYWLDVKNLSDANEEGALARLRWLVDHHGLSHDRLIVESPTFSSLGRFSGDGFRTSYYLPVVRPDELSDAAQEKLGVEFAENARRSEVWAISHPGPMLDFVKTHVLPRLEDVKLLTWFLDKRMEIPEDAAFVQGIVNDTSVEVVLVAHRTSHDR
jgi:heptose-I-phosphate ethanolaminephosphotransferase